MQLLGLWQSSMILQRNCTNTLYGTQASNVTVHFGAAHVKARHTQGGFSVTLPSMSGGGPYEMQIVSDDEEITLTDIYIGDVWLLGGQSNMELPIRRTLDVTQNDISEARLPQIKAFLHSQRYLPSEQDIHPVGEWISADTQRILDFSGIGYYFAKQIAQNQDIPVGIIQTAQGGTKIESWMSAECLRPFKNSYDKYLDSTNTDELNKRHKQNQDEISNWNTALTKLDIGISQQWYMHKPVTKTVQMPQMFDTFLQSGFNGCIWLYKEFTLQSSPLSAARLRLGAIVDADQTYINGQLVGETTYRYPPRIYDIPANVLIKGKNLLAVRVLVTQGSGGLIRQKEYSLISGNESIELSGEWQYAISAECAEAPTQIFPHGYPTWLYNGMIFPMRHTKIKGVAFYQGESNTPEPSDYCERFVAAVSCWRKLFQDAELPFLFVQLANYADPVISGGFAKLRLQQLEVAKQLQNAGMAVSIDVGEDNDLHPQDKITVGERLYLLSRKYAYGENVSPDAPYPECAYQEESQIIISLVNAEELHSQNGTATVEVIYTDGEREAQLATIKGNTLVVSGAKTNAQGVAYLDDDAPQGNLVYNEIGVPCSPFVCNINPMK